MSDYYNTLVEVKRGYEKQVNNLKIQWKEGKSGFTKEKDYKKQLGIWERRIESYEKKLDLLVGE